MQAFGEPVNFYVEYSGDSLAKQVKLYIIQKLNMCRIDIY